MTHQNLAVCFGPVLLTPTQEAWRAAGGVRASAQRPSLGEEFSSAVDFKRHIEALHYLLQLWPGETGAKQPFSRARPVIQVFPHPQCRPVVPLQMTPSPHLQPRTSSRSSQRRRRWCRVAVGGAPLGWRAPRPSTATLGTGACVGRIFCWARRRTMMRSQEVRAMEVEMRRTFGSYAHFLFTNPPDV